MGEKTIFVSISYVEAIQVPADATYAQIMGIVDEYVESHHSNWEKYFWSDREEDV